MKAGTDELGFTDLAGQSGTHGERPLVTGGSRALTVTVVEAPIPGR